MFNDYYLAYIMDNKIYYNRIKDYCRLYSVTYVRLSKLSGLTRSAVSLWAANKCQPTNKDADKIYDFFKGFDKDIKKEDIFPIKPFNLNNLK